MPRTPTRGPRLSTPDAPQSVLHSAPNARKRGALGEQPASPAKVRSPARTETGSTTHGGGRGAKSKAYTGMQPRQEDPRIGGGAKAQGSPAEAAGCVALSSNPQDSSLLSPANAYPSLMGPPPINNHPRSSRSDGMPPLAAGPIPGEYIPASEDSDDDIPLSHYKGVALANVGRDRLGRVIPHKRSEITARKVAIWVAGGATPNDIAVRLNIRPGLVKSCYGKEIEFGQGQINMDMAGHIIRRAKKSDRIAIFYAKARMGWRDGEQASVEFPMLNIHIHL